VAYPGATTDSSAGQAAPTPQRGTGAGTAGMSQTGDALGKALASVGYLFVL